MHTLVFCISLENHLDIIVAFLCFVWYTKVDQDKRGKTMDKFTCPHCKGEVPQGMRFCPHCMTVLEQSQTVDTFQKGKNKKIAVVITAAVLCVALIIVICFFVFKGERKSADSENTSVSNTTTTPSTTTASVSSQHSETLPNELSAENLAAKINQWCSAHSPKYFGIGGVQDITAEQNADGTTLSITDKSGASINISKDKSSAVSLYFRIGHVSFEGNDPHASEILSALGEILFGVDLSGKGSSFSENGYSFEITGRSIPELAYTEYYVTANRS